MSRVNTAKSQQNLRSVDEELDHQIKKSKLLDDDRRTFFINAEDTKRKNNEITEQLKKENKELKKLRDEMLANKRAVTPGFSKTAQSFMSWSGDIKDEKYWRLKLDDEKHLTIRKKNQLLQLQDKLNEVIDTKFGGQEEQLLMRNIRILENQLDKVMIKYNEAQSIKKTYEQIVKRLKEERVGYDNQLAAIERSLKGKEHDFEELLLLAHDATHAKELAQAELKKYEHKKLAVRELRATYLAEKRKAIESREEIINKFEKREKDNREQTLDNRNVNMNMINTHPISQEKENFSELSNINKQKLDDYEEAFRKLYEATGVTDVNEIIQKFTTQDETTKSLQDLKIEYMERIEFLTQEKQKLKDELNDLKYEGSETLTRKQIDEIEQNVMNATNKCERSKIKYERVSKILVNVKAGIEHLVDKLDFFKLEGKPNIIVADDTLVEALAQCVDKMKYIYGLVKNDPNFDYQKFKQLGGGTSSADLIPFNLTLYDKNSKIEGIQKNIRIRLEKDDDDVSDGEIDDDIDMEVTQKLKQKLEMQAKNEKNARTGKKKETSSQSNFHSRGYQKK